MVAAQVRAAPAFEVAGLRPLFDATAFALNPFHQSYDVLPGGRGFVFLRPRRSGQPGAVAVVEAENWFADVRARSAH